MFSPDRRREFMCGNGLQPNVLWQCIFSRVGMDMILFGKIYHHFLKTGTLRRWYRGLCGVLLMKEIPKRLDMDVHLSSRVEPFRESIEPVQDDQLTVLPSHFFIPPQTSKPSETGEREVIKTGYADDIVRKSVDSAKKYQNLASPASKKVEEVAKKQQACDNHTNKNEDEVVRKYPPWADLFGPKSDKVTEKDKIQDSSVANRGPSYFRHARDAAEMRSKAGIVPRSESTDSTSSSSSAADSVASSASSVSPPSTPKRPPKDPVVYLFPPAELPDPNPESSLSNTRIGYMPPSKKPHPQSGYKPFLSGATLDTKVPGAAFLPDTIQESRNGSLTQSPLTPVLCLKIKPRKKYCNVKSDDNGLTSGPSAPKSSTVDEICADRPSNENASEFDLPPSKPEEKNDGKFVESLAPPVPNLNIIRRRNNFKGRNKSRVSLTEPSATSLSSETEVGRTTALSASGIPRPGSLSSSQAKLCNRSSKHASAPMELRLDLIRSRNNSYPGIKSKLEINIDTRRPSGNPQSLNTTLTKLTFLKAQLDVLLFTGPEAILERLRSDEFSRIMSDIAESIKAPSEARSTAPSTPVKEMSPSLSARGPRIVPGIPGAVREMKRLYQQLTIKTACIAISLRSCKALALITSTCLSLAAGERRYLDSDSVRSPSFHAGSVNPNISTHGTSLPEIPPSPAQLPEWQRKLTSQLNGALLTIATYERCMKAHKLDIILFSNAVERWQSRYASVLRNNDSNLWVEVRNHIDGVLALLDSEPGKAGQDKTATIVKVVRRRKESITQIDEFGIEMEYENREEEEEKKRVKVMEKRNEKIGVDDLMKRLSSEASELRREMMRLNLKVETFKV